MIMQGFIQNKNKYVWSLSVRHWACIFSSTVSSLSHKGDFISWYDLYNLASTRFDQYRETLLALGHPWHVVSLDNHLLNLSEFYYPK